MKILCLLGSLLVLLSCGHRESTKETNAGPVQDLPSPVGDSSSLPHLFSDASGRVFLSWVVKRAGNAQLMYSRWEANGWTKPELVSEGTNWFVNWADYPMLTANEDRLLAHFLQKSDTGKYTYDVMVTAAPDGKTWGPAKVLHDDQLKAEHGFVSMLPYRDGFFVCWLDGRKTATEENDHHGHHGEMMLRAAFLDASGAKTDEWELDGRVCDCCQTSAAITPDGPVVVYRDRSASEIRDISIVRFSEGGWSPPHPVHNDGWKIDACPVNGPRMEADGNSLAVAWFTGAGKESKVLVAFSRDGGKSFEKPIRVDSGKAIGRVDLVFADSTSVVVSWLEGSELRAARVHADGKMEPPLRIASTSESRRSGFPQLARAGDRLIFAYTDERKARVSVSFLELK
ncbi:MAG TPA: hypothetical protein VEB63_06065 [Chitinophagaceae bacterium]|nr:hypothetical protein [Chitinophagaceae bacterium]